MAKRDLDSAPKAKSHSSAGSSAIIAIFSIIGALFWAGKSLFSMTRVLISAVMAMVGMGFVIAAAVLLTVFLALLGVDDAAGIGTIFALVGIPLTFFGAFGGSSRRRERRQQRREAMMKRHEQRRESKRARRRPPVLATSPSVNGPSANGLPIQLEPESDRAVGAAWEQAQRLLPDMASTLAAQRRYCAQLLHLSMRETLDPEICGTALLVRRHVPELVNRSEELIHDASVEEQAELRQELVASLSSVAERSERLVTQRRQSQRDALNVYHRRIRAEA